MKVIIAGSRDLDNVSHTLESKVTFVEQVVTNSGMGVTKVLCGGAKGADQWGKAWAMSRHLPVEVYTANWQDYGKAAGMIRNNAMADDADGLILIWDGKSRGSAHMKKAAKLRNLFVHEQLMDIPPIEGKIRTKTMFKKVVHTFAAEEGFQLHCFYIDTKGWDVVLAGLDTGNNSAKHATYTLRECKTPKQRDWWKARFTEWLPELVAGYTSNSKAYKKLHLKWD